MKKQKFEEIKEIDELMSLPRDERVKLSKKWLVEKPDFLKPIFPWWWYYKCQVHILIVIDGGLTYNPLSALGLTEFVKTFEDMQNQALTNIQYKVTLAHRGNPGAAGMFSSYSFIQNRITNFNFDTSVNLNSFDQVWLFGISSGSTLPPNEVAAITTYMNGGGGLFATGDHGTLGSALCDQIPRVKDMRHWDHTDPTSGGNNDNNEVSMRHRRRNDTNRPKPGDSDSLYFDNQSDDVPQEIGVQRFGPSLLPHPLLSISTSLKANGLIDIMPDHPHEGECTMEQAFTVTNPQTNAAQTIWTQILATSFVLSGSTTNGGVQNNGKAETDAHCFPSISVFDGRVANIGRIVIDSTWHHFVNVNLNGIGSLIDLPGLQSGFNATTYRIIQQYFRNITTWMSRRKFMLCWYKFIWVDLLLDSHIVEASMNNPDLSFEEMDPYELMHIGSLAQEIISSKLNPSFAYQFMIDMVEAVNPTLADRLNIWKPEVKEDKPNPQFPDWVDFGKILGMAVGGGFIALRDNMDYLNEAQLDAMDKLDAIFFKGVDQGLNRALQIFEDDINLINQNYFKKRGRKK